MSYSDLEYELFSRQFILKNFNDENILKLNNAKIVIVGLGGIACPLAQYLVSSGVKNLTFFDGDMIEKSNLGRQILYTLEDVGKHKTSVARLKQWNKLKSNPLLKVNQRLKLYVPTWQVFKEIAKLPVKKSSSRLVAKKIRVKRGATLSLLAKLAFMTASTISPCNSLR